MFDPKRISHAAIVVLVFVVARSILGIAVRSSVAALYGVSDVTDAYFAAITIPRRGGDFILGSVVAFVIIPVIERRRAATGDKSAATDVIGLFNVMLLVALALSAGIWLGAPLLLDYVVAPGFDEPTRALAITLTRWCSPLLLLFSVSLIYTSFMHVHRDFLTPALAATLFPLCSLLALWLLPRQLGIVALVYGNLAGCAVGFAVMFLAIRKKLPWRPTLRLGDRAVVRDLFQLAWPVLLTSVVMQVIMVMQQNAASRLPLPGQLSLIEYAQFITLAVYPIVIGPLLTTIYPVMSHHGARDQHAELHVLAVRSFRMVLFLALPLCILTITQSRSIVAVLYAYGKFDQAAVEPCATLIAMLGVIIVLHSVTHITKRLFNVLGHNRAANIATAIIVLVACAALFPAAERAGIHGIAAVYVIASALVTLSDIVILKVQWRSMQITSTFLQALPIFISGALMFAVVFAVKSMWPSQSLLGLTICCVAGVGAYLVGAAFCRLEELTLVRGRVKELLN